MKVREILRPDAIKQNIFGEVHELKRLSLGDLMELVGLIDPESMKTGDPMLILKKGGEALDFILRTSFPSFDGWESFPQAEIPYMIELIWESNDIPGLLRNFTELAERFKGKLPASLKG